MVDGPGGADAQGVTLAAPYHDAMVERGSFVELPLGGAEGAGDLAGHVEGDRQLGDREVLLALGGVPRQKVGDDGTDGAAADIVVAREGGDGVAF